MFKKFFYSFPILIFSEILFHQEVPSIKIEFSNIETHCVLSILKIQKI